MGAKLSTQPRTESVARALATLEPDEQRKVSVSAAETAGHHDAAMHHFQPHRSEHRPCWHCTHYLALIYQGTAVACARGGVQAMPARGCAFWLREVGADDEPDRIPAATVMPKMAIQHGVTITGLPSP